MNKKNMYITMALAGFLALLISSMDFIWNQTARTASAAEPPQFSFSLKTAGEVVEKWPEEAKEAANSMLNKYGAPYDITNSLLIWNDEKPWQEIIVRRDAADHRFPSPHKDTLEQSVAYEVPVDKFDDLARYNGSLIADRTNGTLTSKSQSEAMNFLALNLAHDIITNKRSVEEARELHTEIVLAYNRGEEHSYTKRLKFMDGKIEETIDPDYSPG